MAIFLSFFSHSVSLLSGISISALISGLGVHGWGTAERIY
jgi:hypothetical protein